MIETLMAFNVDHMTRWTRFVAEVEQGYDLTIYDYTNNLAARDNLEADSAGVLKPLDDRFRSATRDAARVLPGAPDDAKWWWRRVPVRPGEELTVDLEREGL